MLTEPSPSLRRAALRRLYTIVDTQWHEVAQALPDLEALAEDSEVEEEVRHLAAKVASRVFFYLEEPQQALRLALESGEGVLDESAELKNQAYVDCLVGAAVDTYVAKMQKLSDGGSSTQGKDKAKDYDDDALPIDKLQAVVQLMFERCYVEQNYEHALGIALEAREAVKVQEILGKCAETGNIKKLYSVLQFAFQAATTLVSSKAFRFQVVQVIAKQLDAMWIGEETPAGIKKSCAFSLANAHQVLRTSKPVAEIVSSLLNGSDDDTLLGLQLCFDLVESGDQTFVNSVSACLKDGGAGEGNSVNHGKAMSILVGGFSSELAISFLHKNSDSDPLIMENMKQALEQRGAGRNSVLHNCAVLSHSYLNAGTTNDAFLRDNLEWMRKASNW